MHEKYLSKDIPFLVDGDCLGISCNPRTSDDATMLCHLVSEGYHREERVFASAAYLASCAQQMHASHWKAYPEAFVFQSMEKLLEDATALRMKSIEDAQCSGVRILLHADDFQEPPLLHNAYHEVMLLLMQGALSIGVAVPNDAGVSLSFLSSFPRLLINGKVCRNHFFFSQVNIEKSIPIAEQLLRNIFHEELTGSNEDKPFPMGVPDMMEHIVDSMGAGVVVGDRYGNMVLLNKAAQKFTGLPPSPLPYAERVRRFGNFLPDTNTPYPLENLPLSRAIRGEQFDYELMFIKNEARPEGAWIRTHGRGLRTPEGELIGGVCVFLDVTEQIAMQKEKEELERALQQTQKFESLGLLAGGVAHDFNNLLVGVMGNVSLLLQDTALDGHHRLRLQQVEEASTQLSDLTQQLLTYAGISDKKALEVLDLGDVCETMSSLLKSGVDKSVEVHFNFADIELPVQVDATQIKQILLNLTMNASDAMQGSFGEINIRTYIENVSEVDLRTAFFSEEKKEGEYVVLEISDNGCGMSPEVLDRVFDPFYSSKGIGRGLGLSSVLGIIKAHGACLKVDSQIGIGTTFSIYFPIQEALSKKKIKRDVQEIGTCFGLKALVVDDEPMVLDVAKGILEHQHFSVETKTSGREAMKFLEDIPKGLSLAVLDMTLPDASGLDIYKRIRSERPYLPVVISSGFSKELCGTDFEGDPFCRYLAKPYPVATFIETIEELLSESTEEVTV